jgi:hypothetical protein
MSTRPAILSLFAFAATLTACRTVGNDRSNLGDAASHSAVRLTDIHGAGTRAETPRADDGTSLAGLSRAGWSRQTIAAPVEGTNAYRRYTRNYQITEATSRQRGDFPTPLSALELTGATRDGQVLEVLAAGPHAFYEGAVLVPRMFFVRPCEEVRATPSDRWRAPVSTLRYSLDERTPEAPDPDSASAPD